MAKTGFLCQESTTKGTQHNSYMYDQLPAVEYWGVAVGLCCKPGIISKKIKNKVIALADKADKQPQVEEPVLKEQRDQHITFICTVVGNKANKRNDKNGVK